MGLVVVVVVVVVDDDDDVVVVVSAVVYCLQATSVLKMVLLLVTQCDAVYE